MFISSFLFTCLSFIGAIDMIIFISCVRQTSEQDYRVLQL